MTHAWHDVTPGENLPSVFTAVVEIPMGFTEMIFAAPDLALAWRMATRELFTVYFSRGYRAVDFRLDRAARKGAYLLIRT